MKRKSRLSCKLIHSASLGAVLAGEVLVLAYDSAQRLEINPWKLAVRWPFLRQSIGVQADGLHWLLSQELLLHQEETWSSSEAPRQFRPSQRKHFTARSCFALEEEAVPVLRALLAAHASQLATYQQLMRQLRLQIQTEDWHVDSEMA